MWSQIYTDWHTSDLIVIHAIVFRVCDYTVLQRVFHHFDMGIIISKKPQIDDIWASLDLNCSTLEELRDVVSAF